MVVKKAWTIFQASDVTESIKSLKNMKILESKRFTKTYEHLLQI